MVTDPNEVHKKLQSKFKQDCQPNQPKKYFRLNPENVDVEMDATSGRIIDQLIRTAEEYLNTERMQKKFNNLVRLISAKGYYINSITQSKMDKNMVNVVVVVRSRLPGQDRSPVRFDLNILPLGSSSKIVHALRGVHHQ
eukprot:CAMPEP_0177642938 /NCGR_PEP_ID=MMETSP0447-20121125/7884_1 /TAXON_ID=0 /ORGANISM="Stygamoeba regulata, Strain BSH-02190019" /LENGTH=138 /DNA_ID=CAMNT_0019145191 /DNA_START=93 /DNA_END=509 /DNA_ORIENTATION=+